MLTKFIEIHLSDDDCLVTLNVDHIVGISNTDNNGSGYAVKTSDRGGWFVKESYDELKQLIFDAGCLIKKKDPRLDLEHTLTWDELCKLEMIGEPVYNSNTLRWMLLIDNANDGTWIELINHAGGHEKWIEHDARKFPLYRMRK